MFEATVAEIEDDAVFLKLAYRSYDPKLGQKAPTVRVLKEHCTQLLRNPKYQEEGEPYWLHPQYTPEPQEECTLKRDEQGVWSARF